MDKIRQLHGMLIRFIWEPNLDSMSIWRRLVYRVMRMAYAVVRDAADGQLTLRAMSLVYTTLLSLVPLLAVSFSVLKAFGVHNQLEPMLLNFLHPLGDRGADISRQILDYVENVKVGVLGSVGLALLFFTVVSLMQKIERSFNYTWRVSRHRSFAQRFSDYLSVILIGPVLVFSSLGVTASVSNTALVQHLSAMEPFGTLIHSFGKLIPYLLITIAFTFVYSFVPNTRVRILSAFTGALVAGFLWESVGWGFARFIAGSTKYAAIYSSLAILIFFMIWLFVGWMILLIGASIAFYHQHPEHLAIKRERLHLSGRQRERLALVVMQKVGTNYYAGTPPWSAADLADHLGIPMEVLERAARPLEDTGLLVRSEDEPHGWLPGRPLETTPVEVLLEAVRTHGEASFSRSDQVPGAPVVDEISDEVERAVSRALAHRTLKDLAVEATAQPAQNGEQVSAAGPR